MNKHSDTCSGTDTIAKTMVDVTFPVSDPEAHNQPTLDLKADNQRVGAADLKAGAKAIQFHPLAEIFPELDNHRLRELAADIEKNGLIEPLLMYEDKILDGHSRYRACQMAGVEPAYVDYTGDDPVGHIVSRNLQRRHLDDGQRAMVAARIADLPVGANQHRSEGVPNGRAAEMLNVSTRSVARAKNVLKDGIPAVADAVGHGEIPVAAAEQIAHLPELEQEQALQERVKDKKNKKKKKKEKKKTDDTKSSTNTPTPAQHAETAPTEQPQAASDTPDDGSTVRLPEADDFDGAALIEFVNFILPRIDTIVATLPAEDVNEFKILADRVRSVINQKS